MIHCNTRMGVWWHGVLIPEYRKETDAKPFRIFRGDMFQCVRCDVLILANLSDEPEHEGEVTYLAAFNTYNEYSDRWKKVCRINN